MGEWKTSIKTDEKKELLKEAGELISKADESTRILRSINCNLAAIAKMMYYKFKREE